MLRRDPKNVPGAFASHSEIVPLEQAMSLHLIATPIGHLDDISQRAIATIKAADVVVGEERREVSTLLKRLGIEGKRLELLNEHSSDQDVNELKELCRVHTVALVSDCGTPGFCDPGARLVAACRSGEITTSPIPGASSLMCLLSVSGHDMREFLFRGFLPAEREARAQALRELERERRPVILMDTPYRLGRLLSELSEHWPERRALLGCDFTQPTETVIEAELKRLPELVGERKAEFILAVFPMKSGPVDSATPKAQRGPSTASAKAPARGRRPPFLRKR